MLQARSALNNELVLAAPGRDATCPQCGGRVIAKCGDIKIPHFAHATLEDCDTWTEPETAWHHAWKLSAPEHRREVVIGNHRADAVDPHGVVFEFQHSHLAPAAIHEREDHYGNMVWVFDIGDVEISVYHSREAIDRGYDANYRAFRWSHPRFHVGATRQPTMLDHNGTHLLLVDSFLFDYTPYGGTGWLIQRSAVGQWLRDGTRPRGWPDKLEGFDDPVDHRWVVDFAADPTTAQARDHKRRRTA